MVSILLLRKGTYPYEYMDDQKKFNENLLPEKEGCYSSHLYMEDITDTDYTHVKKVYKNFEIKNFGQNSDLCDQGDTLLLAGGFENFQNMCFKIYEPDPASFVTSPGLT